MSTTTGGFPVTIEGYTLRYLPDGVPLADVVNPPTWSPETPDIIAGTPAYALSSTQP